MFNEELAREYGCKGLGKCPFHKPENLCDEAWKAFYQYVFALSNGCGIFYQGDWIDKPGVAICSCNDGIRPVVFKIERMEENSDAPYTAVV